MSKKKDDASNAFNEFMQLIQPLVAIANSMQRMIDGAKEAEQELATNTANKARLEKETAALKKEKSEFEASLPKVRERMDAARTEERKQQEEHAQNRARREAETVELEKRNDQLKLAIKNSAAELGGLIAQELV
jgi:SMC interacting uncharacterized protein involved in chromosome segregation